MFVALFPELLKGRFPRGRWSGWVFLVTTVAEEVNIEIWPVVKAGLSTNGKILAYAGGDWPQEGVSGPHLSLE